MSDGTIETVDLTYWYSGNDWASLDDVSIKIRKGVKTVILGANGAGKSTLFYHFNGVFKPSAGSASFNGEVISYRRKALRALRSKVSVVLQNPDDQIFGQTVEEDVAYGPTNLGLDDDEIESRVSRALRLVGLDDLRDRNTLKLSYGQRKRLALAGALAMEPEVLIMDEPTAGLDPQMALELMELAEQLHHSGTTVVISTHDVDLAYAWADEIHVLRRGELIYSGRSEEFYSDPIRVYTTGVMQPSMFLINKSLCDMRGQPEAPYPRTETQLISKMASGPKGRFLIMPVSDRLDKYMVDAAVDEVGGDLAIGLYGAVTRSMLFDSMLPVNYVFDGFESCMSECLMGRDSLLLCDADCVDLILAKMERLKDFGTVVEFKVLDDPHSGSAWARQRSSSASRQEMHRERVERSHVDQHGRQGDPWDPCSKHRRSEAFRAVRQGQDEDRILDRTRQGVQGEHGPAEERHREDDQAVEQVERQMRVRQKSRCDPEEAVGEARGHDQHHGRRCQMQVRGEQEPHGVEQGAADEPPCHPRIRLPEHYRGRRHGAQEELVEALVVGALQHDLGGHGAHAGGQGGQGHHARDHERDVVVPVHGDPVA